MRLLLDTHVFLWLTTEHPSLSDHHRDAFLDDGAETFLSAASYWEICIKYALGKLKLTPDWPEHFDREVLRSRIRWLPVERVHCQALLSLPHHHRDPFDRMLVAQALSEDLVIATTDRRIRRYAVETI